MKAVLTLPRGPSRTHRRRQARRAGQDHRRRRQRRLGRGRAVAGAGRPRRSSRACTSIRDYLAPALIGHDVVRHRRAARDDEPGARGRPRSRPADREVRDRRRGARPDLQAARHPAAELARRQARRPRHAGAAGLGGDARRGGAASRAQAVAEGYRGFKVKVGHHKALDAEHRARGRRGRAGRVRLARRQPGLHARGGAAHARRRSRSSASRCSSSRCR